MNLTKTTLFQAGEAGYTTYRIPAIAVTEQGTALAFCSARRGRGGDWDRNDIVLRRSEDGGETWSPATVIATHDEQVVDNPVPIAAADGTVHFLYQEHYARVYYTRSTDEGRTWEAPAEITGAFEAFRPEYDWKVVAPGPGHGLELRHGPDTGRLVVPVWLCKPDKSIPGGDHRPSCVATVYSDDSGRTWQRGEIVADTSERIVHPSEHTAAQLADGRVMLNIRSESSEHRRLVTTSADGATGWSEPVFDGALFEPVCFGSLLNLRHQDGQDDLLLFSNPDSRHRTSYVRESIRFRWRENLAVKLSRDGGKTWATQRVVEPGVAGYSDLAEGPDGTIYLLYEGGALRGRGGNAYVACARFGLDWLTAMEEPRGGEPKVVQFTEWRESRDDTRIRTHGLVNYTLGARGLNSGAPELPTGTAK